MTAQQRESNRGLRGTPIQSVTCTQYSADSDFTVIGIATGKITAHAHVSASDERILTTVTDTTTVIFQTEQIPRKTNVL